MYKIELPDLVIDEKEIESSSHLEDRPLLFLQCAMEENCLSSSAYNINKNDYGNVMSVIHSSI